jgi:hypothetical protein
VTSSPRNTGPHGLVVLTAGLAHRRPRPARTGCPDAP